VWDRVTGRSVQGAKVYAIGADGLVHQATTSQEGIYALRYVAPGSFRVTAFQDQNRDQEIDSGEVQGSAPADLSSGDTLLLDIAVLQPDTIPAVLRRAAAADSVTLVLEFDDFLLPEAPVGELEVGLMREEGEAPGIAVLYHEADYAAHVEQVADSFARLDSIDRAEAGARAAATADSVAAANAAADPAGLDTAAAAGAAASPPPAAADSAGAVAGPPEAVRDTAGAGDDPARAAADTAGAAADPTALEPGAVPENPPPITPVRPAPGRQVGGRAPPEPTAPGRRPPISLQALAGSRPGPVEGTDRVLPGRRIVALLDAPVEVEVEYTVTVAGVVNINGLGGGAGEAVFVLAAPEVDTTTLDDPLAPPDTGSAQPDTGGVAPDAGALVPDAGAVLPDTGAVLPDTGAVLPDTGSVVPAAGTVAPVISSPVGRPRPGRSVPFERPRHQRPWTGPPTPR